MRKIMPDIQSRSLLSLNLTNSLKALVCFLQVGPRLPLVPRGPSRHMFAGVTAPDLTPRPTLARTAAIWLVHCARGRMSSAHLTRPSSFRPMGLSTGAALRNNKDTSVCQVRIFQTAHNHKRWEWGTCSQLIEFLWKSAC
jgi:hypothetical protein